MTPFLTFTFGIFILLLFGWYFIAGRTRTKRILGTSLTILLVAGSIQGLNPPGDKIRLGLDLQGGTSFLIRLLKDGGRAIEKHTLDQAVEVIRKRVDQFGVSEPIITPQGTDRILVQIPGLNPEQIKDARFQLQQVAKLEFRLVHPDSDNLVPEIEAGTALPPSGYSIEPNRHGIEGRSLERKLLIKRKADLLGDQVTRAGAYYDTNGWGVHLQFDSGGAAKFGELTKQVFEERSRMAILLDGKVISAPGVENGPIYGGSAQISGGQMSEKEARDLASVLENPLQNPVTIEEERSVSATLGGDSIKSGIYSGLLGLGLTFLFVLIYYRFAGVVANIALIINLILLFGATTMFNFVLTLPGIAGIILTIGMAVDANVLIYERLREELSAGKPLRAALDASYDKAFSAIFDSNLTTLITAIILFWQATGPVRGFAVTLTIGIVASMFSALLVTRNCFSWAIETGMLKRVSMSNLVRPTSFDFMSKGRLAMGLSVAALVALTAIFAVRGEKNFGVDFKGGDMLVLEASRSITESQVRTALKEIGLEESIVQAERSPAKEFLTIRSGPGTSEKIEKHLKERFSDAGLRIEQSDKVGKVVSDELTRNSLVALALGMVGIFIYVTVRFEMSFAVAAILAVAHDVVFTVGAFALFDRELSLIIVGAVLTIAGYSINDTIVVFDRIRERIGFGEGDSLKTVMNRSINDTLSRTILTGGTTVLSTLALYFFGGPVLNDFAFAILIGLLVGTYSSIFVASPVVLWWTQRKGQTQSISSEGAAKNS
jgi:SecD/SecF fusion protein